MYFEMQLYKFTILYIYLASVFTAGEKLREQNHDLCKLPFHRNFMLGFLLLLAGLETQTVILKQTALFLAM